MWRVPQHVGEGFHRDYPWVSGGIPHMLTISALTEKKIIQDSPVVLQEGGRKNLSPEIYLKL